MKKIISQTLVIISVVTILFLIAVFLYQTFFRPNYTGGGNIITIILFDIIIGEEKLFNSIADACRYIDPNGNNNFASLCATISSSALHPSLDRKSVV